MNTLEILKAARRLIANRKRWTKGGYARTSRSLVTYSSDPRAVRWCSLGAIYKICGQMDRSGWDAASSLTKAAGGSLVAFNDSASHRAVLACWDAAIAELEAK